MQEQGFPSIPRYSSLALIKYLLIPSDRKASYSAYIYTQGIDGIEQLN